jgi:uncharacterized Zn-finger protein
MSAGKLAGLSHNPWLTRLALGLSIVSAIVAVVLSTSIDTIVNHDLYRFGLQFDSAWYDPYSVYTKLIYACLGISAAISAVVLVLSFMNKSKTSETMIEKDTKSLKKIGKSEEQVVSAEKPKPKQKVADTTCPACKRVFSKPVMMLNMVDGKPKMVSTCPYCSEVLATEGK